MNCNHCSKAFNSHNRIPKLLPNCGHCLCKECLVKLLSTTFSTFRCPFDNIQYPRDQTYNDNLYVMSMLAPEDNPEESKSVQCKLHARALDIFCQDCKEEICSDCVLFGQHKSHDYDQLTVAKAKNEAKIRKYLQHFISIKESIDNKNVKKNINDVRDEKVRFINLAFDGIIEELEKARKISLDVVCGIYESYGSSVDNLWIRTEELITSTNQAIDKGDHTYVMRKEDSFNKELQQIEKFTTNCIFKGKEAIDKKLTLNFDTRMQQHIEKFCTIIKGSGPKQVERKESSSTKIRPDDDLLHQSFTDLIKNADSLLNADCYEKDMGNKTPTNNQYKRMADQVNQSPVSYFSNCSGFKGNFREEKSMLSKNKLSTHSIMSNNSINPIYTTKKPRTPLNFSPNLSNVSKVTKNSTSPSPFKTDIPSSRLNEIIVVDKENSQKLTNSSDPEHLNKLKKALERAEKAALPVLDLSKCELDDKAIEDLSKTIAKLSKVKTINLDGNSISEVGLKHLLKNIKDNNVEYLFINQNKLKDSALDYLISFRKYNAKLKAVYMSNNPINQASHKVKAKANMLDDNNIVVVL